MSYLVLGKRIYIYHTWLQLASNSPNHDLISALISYPHVSLLLMHTYVVHILPWPPLPFFQTYLSSFYSIPSVFCMFYPPRRIFLIQAGDCGYTRSFWPRLYLPTSLSLSSSLSILLHITQLPPSWPQHKTFSNSNVVSLKKTNLSTTVNWKPSLTLYV